MTLSKFGPWQRPTVRKLLLTVFCLAISVAGHAAMKTEAASDAPLTATKVFADVPLEVLDMLRPSTRLDMIDYYTQADSLLTVTNALGGESRFELITPDYLRVAVSPVSRLEIKILGTGKKQTVMTLYTTGDSDMAQDTDVRFFDSSLRPLDVSKYLKAPKLTDFFTLKGSGICEEDLREKVAYAAIAFSTGPGDEPLKATFTSLRTISQDDCDLLTPILTPILTAPWQGKYTFK